MQSPFTLAQLDVLLQPSSSSCPPFAFDNQVHSKSLTPTNGTCQTWAHEAEVNDIAEFGGTQQGLGRGSGAGHAHFSPAASAGTRRSTVGSSQNWGDSRLELGMSGRSFGGSRAELDVTGRSFGGSRAELDITGNASEWGMSTRGDMEDTLSPGNEMRLPEFGRPGHSRGFGT